MTTKSTISCAQNIIDIKQTKKKRYSK